jgi:methyltransferase (TIGR00027 family)
MSTSDPLIRDISDTARWAAVYRAWETERPDALFRDPFARRLAGARGEQIAQAMPQGKSLLWPWIARTYLFDQLITQQVKNGADLVVNLAAGLDARPYRMTLPAALRWVEIDLPGILDFKNEILRSDKPACELERIPLDLADVADRRRIFERLGHDARQALVISEGLIIYFTADEVGSLGHDLARVEGFQHWLLDLASPGLLRMLQKNWNAQLSQAGAVLRFAPAEGPGFFEPYGWKAIDVRGFLKAAARAKRVALWMRLLALLPESKRPPGNRPWAAACLFAKASER